MPKLKEWAIDKLWSFLLFLGFAMIFIKTTFWRFMDNTSVGGLIRPLIENIETLIILGIALYLYRRKKSWFLPVAVVSLLAIAYFKVRPFF